MPLPDNGGTEEYWYDGLPSSALQPASGALDAGTEQYWFDGVPALALFPTAGPPPPTSDISPFVALSLAS